MNIKQLKEALSNYPDDADVVIVDADTACLLNISTIELSNYSITVVIGGNYSDQYTGEN